MKLSRHFRFRVVVFLVIAAVGLGGIFGCAEPATAPTTPKSAPTPVATPTSTPAATQVMKWRMAGSIPEGSAAERVITKFCDSVKQQTGGALDIKFYPNEMLMKSTEEAAAVMRGSLELAQCTTGYDSSAMPDLGVMALPSMGISRASWETLVKRDGKVRSFLEKIYEEKDLKLLAMWNLGTLDVVSLTPITKVEQFKGLKMRATGKALPASMKLLGAQAVSMTGDESVEAMRNRLLDCAENTRNGTFNRGYYDFARYYCLWEFYPLWQTFYVGKKRFEALSPDIQKVLSSAAAKTESELWEVSKTDDADLEAKMKAKGMTIVPVPLEEKVRMADMTKGVREDWIAGAGANAKSIVNIIKEFAGK